MVTCKSRSDGFALPTPTSLSAFYAGLSPDSLAARFLGYTQGISNGLARSFCTLDHMHDEGFVAVAEVEGVPQIVGHLCFADVGPAQA